MFAVSLHEISKSFFEKNSPSKKFFQLLFPSIFKSTANSEFKALKNISFDIKRGECFGIVGRNGAGKSTLLQIIAGVLQATNGKLELNGSVSALLELGAGFNPDLSGLENIRLTGLLKGLTEENVDGLIEEAIAFADIGDFINKPVKTYSSGMYMRVAFAANTMSKPDILIVDEALAVGDMTFQKKCMQRFYEIKESGSTIIFVSHDPYQLRHVCDRAVLIENGELVSIGQVDSVVSKYEYLLQESASQNVFKENNSNVGGGIIIDAVEVMDLNGKSIGKAKTGDNVIVNARVRVIDKVNFDKLHFVLNMYRHDDLYICGFTTEMDGLEAFSARDEMNVTIKISSLPVLSGHYKFRFAVNDESGLGILTELVPACYLEIEDDFQSVGLINLERNWVVN